MRSQIRKAVWIAICAPKSPVNHRPSPHHLSNTRQDSPYRLQSDWCQDLQLECSVGTQKCPLCKRKQMHPSAAGNRPSKLHEPHNVSMFCHLILITNLDWKSATMSRLSEIFDEPSSLMYVCLRCHMYSCKSSRHTIHDAHSREAYLHLNITVVWYTTPHSLAHRGHHFRNKKQCLYQLFKTVVQITVTFWVFTLCSVLCLFRRFGRTYCLHLQGGRIGLGRRWNNGVEEDVWVI